MYLVKNPQSAAVLTRRTLGAYRARPAAIRHPHRYPVTLRGTTSNALIGGGSTAATIGTTALLSTFTSIGAAAGPIGAAVGAAIGLVAGLFTGHHAAAVATEGNTLNSAQPAFYQTLAQIVAAYNSGQLTAASASAAVDQAVATFYSNVGGIMKKGGPCKALTPGGGKANIPGGDCNAACYLGCDNIEPCGNLIKTALASGGGSVSCPATTSNGAIGATPAVYYEVGGAAGSVTGAISSLPMWVWFAGGGVLLLMLVMGTRR